MLFERWGAQEAPMFVGLDRPIAQVLLGLYGGLLVFFLFRHRRQLMRAPGREWLLAAALALLALPAAQILAAPASLGDVFSSAAAPGPALSLGVLSAVPLLAAATFLNPALALLVGLATGLSLAYWGGHGVFAIGHFALAGYLAGVALSQSYRGRLYAWLRQPLLVGPLALVALTPLIALAAAAQAPATANALAAVDLAVIAVRARILPLAIAGLLAGGLVAILVMGAPQWRRAPRELVPAPTSVRLNRRLVSTFALVAVPVLLIMVGIFFWQARQMALDLVVQQMAHDADTVAAQIPDFRADRQNLLREFASRPALPLGDAAAAEALLSDLHRGGDLFDGVLYVDGAGAVLAAYPPEGAIGPLSDVEQTAVHQVVRNREPLVSAAESTLDGAHLLTFIHPVFDANDQVTAALIGRVPELDLDTLIVGLYGGAVSGDGFIVDENDIVIAEDAPRNTRVGKVWKPEAGADRNAPAASIAGYAYDEISDETNTRELFYVLEGTSEQPWKVVLTAPYEVVTAFTFQFAWPMLSSLGVVVLLFGATLLALGRSVTAPMTRLAGVARQIAEEGALDTPVEASGDDEIGQLGRAFDKMQRTMKRRLDELSLLVKVGQDVSASLNIDDGMPHILQGAVRGTGAAGARAVVVNPVDRHPLTFGAGPAAEAMGAHDRAIMSRLRQQRELILQTPAAVREMLGMSPQAALPFQALIAIALYSQERFQGVFWLAYRQARAFDDTALNLVRTLASQASVLVENDRLYTTASSGRRRLLAVLASTTDAVIVTDPTDRILLINPAMERAFQMQATTVIGRAVADVIKDPELLQALARNARRVRNLEIVTESGRTFYANASPIISSDGQAMGRVAVLHDITRLKEIDKMKSEFVSTVSHDLRGPLSYMRGYASMLPMAGELNEQQQIYTDKILSGISQMNTLVVDLLDLGRIESGMPLDIGTVRLNKVLKYVATDYRQPAQAAGLNIVIETSPDIPPIDGDKKLIRQAINNLVGNALKYAPFSGDLILRARAEQDGVVISVVDHGPGISEDDLARLFDKFFRVQHRHTDKIKGSGLGLAIVRSIVERHGGRVWCESQTGQGSAFHILLPNEPPADAGKASPNGDGDDVLIS